eukprot:1868695-Rhodomonas_salina.3
MQVKVKRQGGGVEWEEAVYDGQWVKGKKHGCPPPPCSLLLSSLFSHPLFQPPLAPLIPPLFSLLSHPSSLLSSPSPRPDAQQGG